MTGPGTKTISVSIPEGFTPDKNKPICVVVPSQTYAGGFSASAETEKEIFRSAHYRQTGNIDFQGETFHSIGKSTTDPFKGIYDGGGYKISNIMITNPASGCATGMFGYLDSGAKVLGVKIDNASINASANDNGFIAGCIQPSSDAIIKNCEVSKSSLTSSNAQNGGMIGLYSTGVYIAQCSSRNTIVSTGDLFAGGHAGRNGKYI